MSPRLPVGAPPVEDDLDNTRDYIPSGTRGATRADSRGATRAGNRGDGPSDGLTDSVDVGGIPALFADRARMAAVWTGFGAAALGFFGSVVVALAMWIPDAAATGTSGSTVRGGLLAFLAAQHGGVRIDGVHIGFIPLGLTWFAVYLCWRSGRVLWALPAVVGDVGRRRVLELTAVQTVSYAATTTVVSFYAVVGRSSASPVAVALGSVAVGLAGFGSVASTMTPVGGQCWQSLPASVRGSAKAGAAAVCTFLAGGAVLAFGSTVVHIGRFLDLTRGMGRGLSGLPVAVGDTLAAPNAVLAATSYLAGPGFAVGDHATYAPFGGHGGLVPAFPVLAALPDGEHASLTVLTLLAVTVLGAGIAAGVIVARETVGVRWPVALGVAAGSGACAGVVLAGLTALAGGPLGARRLQTVGASPVQVGLAALVEVALVAMATVGGRRLLAHHAARDRGVSRAKTRDVNNRKIASGQFTGVDDAVDSHTVTGEAEVSATEASDTGTSSTETSSAVTSSARTSGAETSSGGTSSAETSSGGTSGAETSRGETSGVQASGAQASGTQTSDTPVAEATHSASHALAAAMRRSMFTRTRAARSGRSGAAEDTAAGTPAGTASAADDHAGEREAS